MICPCQMQQPSALSYAQCCERFHQGETPSTPAQLMRSRFSGFVLGLTDYIERTWHPSTCPKGLTLSPDDHWRKLEIVKAKGSQVHFRAYFKDEDGFAVLEEISDFILDDERWLYVNGETETRTVLPGRNDMCLCGSGKKFKKCCA